MVAHQLPEPDVEQIGHVYESLLDHSAVMQVKIQRMQPSSDS